MAPIKFLLALSSLAILSCSLGPTSANALSVDNRLVHRHIAHEGLAKKKRTTVPRCRERSPPSDSTPTPTPTPQSTPDQPVNDIVSTPASSASAPPQYTTPSTSTGGSKLSVAWALGNDPRLALLAPPKTTFLYTWSPDQPDLAKTLGFELVPQLWGRNQVDDFKNKVVAGYAKYAIGMNEPNQVGQSDMTPGEGAWLWQTYLQPLKSLGYTLGSPATTSNPNGMVWMQDFMSQCQGCTFDFMCVHWYDTTFEKFQTYLELWHNTFGLPVWVTEYACQNFNGGDQPSNDQIWAFYTQAVAFLEQTEWIHMHSPFGFMDGMDNVNPADRLFGDSNGLSALGGMILDLASSS